MVDKMEMSEGRIGLGAELCHVKFEKCHLKGGLCSLKKNSRLILVWSHSTCVGSEVLCVTVAVAVVSSFIYRVPTVCQAL